MRAEQQLNEVGPTVQQSKYTWSLKQESSFAERPGLSAGQLASSVVKLRSTGYAYLTKDALTSAVAQLKLFLERHVEPYEEPPSKKSGKKKTKKKATKKKEAAAS